MTSRDGRADPRAADGRGSKREGIRLRQDLLAALAANGHEVAERAGYLLNFFAAALAAQDPRKKLVAAVLADFKRLSDES